MNATTVGRANQVAGAMTPEGLFAIGAVSQYAGASVAVLLFDRMDAAGVTWFRVVGAAILLVLLRRSWRRTFTREQMVTAAIFGTVTAFMNLFFYLAIDQLPLGNAVAIELWGRSSLRRSAPEPFVTAGALALAVGGVILLAEVRPEGTTTGFIYALVAGGLWAAYIVFGHRVARNGTAIDGLGIGMAIGALALTPVAIWSTGPGWRSPWLLIVAIGAGLLSTVIPYGIDQNVLARITRARFAILQALLPVTALLMGLVILDQRPSVAELAGVALVISALVLRD